MARRRIVEIEYGRADVKLAYQKIVRQAKRNNKTFDFTFQQFENRVNKRMTAGIKIREALRREVHSTAVASYATIAAENILDVIRERFPDVYRRITQLIGEVRKNGKFASLSSELTWNDALSAYTFVDKFDNTWIIELSNSPTDIDIKMI